MVGLRIAALRREAGLSQAQLAQKLKEAGNNAAFEQVMAAVSDFEKGNMRLSVVLASLNAK